MLSIIVNLQRVMLILIWGRYKYWNCCWGFLDSFKRQT